VLAAHQGRRGPREWSGRWPSHLTLDRRWAAGRQGREQGRVLVRGQMQRRGQRRQGLRMWPTSQPVLDGAERGLAEPRLTGEGGLAEPSTQAQPTQERADSAPSLRASRVSIASTRGGHGRSVLPPR